MTTVVVPPNAVLWFTQYLRAGIRANGYPTARVADTYKGDDVEVWVQRDGGAELDQIRDEPRIRINVYHKGATSEGVDDLTDLVIALMKAAPGNGPVKRVRKTSGPSSIADKLPRRYMLFEAVLVGSPRTIN